MGTAHNSKKKKKTEDKSKTITMFRACLSVSRAGRGLLTTTTLSRPYSCLPEGFHKLSEGERKKVVTDLRKDVKPVDPHHSDESPEEFDKRWELIFADPELDQWMMEERLNELFAHDVIPDPKVVSSALYATRRLDDFAMSVRI